MAKRKMPSIAPCRSDSTRAVLKVSDTTMSGVNGVDGVGMSAAAKRIDQNSEQGKALQQVVQTKLKDFLGADYADDVLPLYIVVMLAHGNQADLVAESLEAFLGQGHAELFVQWYAR